ncbi:hypothetical protein BDB00DRAFT_871926 [Zychaea mexicana]|uniref:uncharacterized protein n=1 Tax=Zychaea mexicana TaxID=64656 RepID=UPI0022FE1A8F|nr:uncharacterized protein BDB00DRAFT_871926 [Zychaea mexicana]KAI9493925.1 hypothetical protein BDB00DRAFT_871926 [Zychaea mexicana]
MNIADILNPTAPNNTCTPTIYEEEHRLLSPPLSPFHAEDVHYLQQHQHPHYYGDSSSSDANAVANNYGKPRSRFSEYEDAVICEGVARGLTWGQISGQLPHRKRATCFNRYRTLQGIRKSRKRSSIVSAKYKPLTPPSSRRASIVSCSTRTFFTPSPSPPLASSPWLPTTPPLSTNNNNIATGNHSNNDARYYGDYDLVRTPSAFASLSRPSTLWMEPRPCSYYQI